MAQPTLYVNHFDHRLGPDETLYFVLGPGNFKGAVTVTAIPADYGTTLPQYMEVIQTGIRAAAPEGYNFSYWLDIVVRNNTHVGDSNATVIDSFNVSTSVIA